MTLSTDIGVAISPAVRSVRSRTVSEEFMRSLINALPVALYATDASGRITYYNEAAVA